MSSHDADVERLLAVARALALRASGLGATDPGARFAVTAAELAATLGQASADGDKDHDEAAFLEERERLVALAVAGLDRLVPGGRVDRLRAAADLDALDLQIVAALLAPELESAIERVYIALWNDFARKRPDVGFVAGLVGGRERDARNAVLQRLAVGAPLRRHHVIVLGPGDAMTPHALRPVRLADRVVAFLRGHDDLDESIHAISHLASAPAVAALVLPAEVVSAVRNALGLGRVTAARLALVGAPGTGRAQLVAALAAEANRPALHVDGAALLADSATLADRLGAVLREAALRGAVAVFEDLPEELAADHASGLVAVLRGALATAALPLVFLVTAPAPWLSAITPDLVSLHVPAPTYAERLELWRRAFPPSAIVEPADLETVAARYAFTAATIARAAGDAARTARIRDAAHGRITLADLGDAARRSFSTRLGELAQRIPTAFRWEDLVLPPDTIELLREIVRFAQLRPHLLETWGFGAKLPYGRGVSTILVGPPGTGKTMLAQLLAHELGYDLYRIDLSQVVNKYIGETEKNLGRIFEEAERSHAVLFFDEADSLFAKRTDVRSSNDRYANLEVNYLLQRMETYDGITILATNLEQGLDPAFKRRVRFAVQLELPEVNEREKLWRGMFPPATPLAQQIDWARIAKTFEMSGSYIKKAALRAAAAAAAEHRAIETGDLLAAAELEYRDMGRIVSSL